MGTDAWGQRPFRSSECPMGVGPDVGEGNAGFGPGRKMVPQAPVLPLKKG